MKSINTSFVLALVASLAVASIGVGCKKDAGDHMESAGENIKDAAHDTKEGIKDAAEKTGEAIKEGAKDTKDAVTNAWGNVTSTNK